MENCEPEISENSSSSTKINQNWITEREPAIKTLAYVFTTHPPVYLPNVSKRMYVYVFTLYVYYIYILYIITLIFYK